MHALIIEDQFAIAMLLEDLLRDLGYTSFDIVQTEKAGISAAKERCPDLITADDRLTDGSGIDAVQEICAARAIPVVFIVGDSLELNRRMPDAVVLMKPFRTHEFADAVGQALVRGRRGKVSGLMLAQLQNISDGK
ncbi:MAG TPA: response regulator [Allosphingosinicella sp.]|jgi:DNA-binding response OmpR family regulator